MLGFANSLRIISSFSQRYKARGSLEVDKKVLGRCPAWTGRKGQKSQKKIPCASKKGKRIGFD